MGELIIGLLLTAFGVWLINRNVEFTLFHLIPIPRWLMIGPILLIGIGMLIDGIRFILW